MGGVGGGSLCVCRWGEGGRGVSVCVFVCLFFCIIPCAIVTPVNFSDAGLN